MDHSLPQLWRNGKIFGTQRSNIDSNLAMAKRVKIYMLLLNERILLLIRAYGGVYIARSYYTLEANIAIHRHFPRPLYYYSLLQFLKVYVFSLKY